ncbi:Trichothecene C-3 esterase [Lachnellula suecica]|uniref:Trichothecene C-3 esterase n=1 Tax=Lachnellula suecica TaxID=602035 RepID=A0A8T9C220_9HELO|nr:Trichothecene C-3 esterase [Lachnellula suecica]
MSSTLPFHEMPVLLRTVLKIRSSAYPIVNIGNCISTFQVLFRTTDTNSNSSWAVTTVFIPASQAYCTAANPAGCSHAIVSYEVPYDSASPDAAPSYLLQFSEPYGEMYDLLTRGYWVNVPDYEGPTASYTAGVQAGHATLDSIRAVLQVADSFGLQMTNARVALWGYSGGASATEFAAELAGTYAPELKIAGVVQGGLCTNMSSVFPRMNGQDTAGLVIASLIGITSQHIAARTFMNTQLKQSGPYNASLFYTAATMNGNQVLTAFEYTNVYDYFLNGIDDLNALTMREMFNSNGVMGIHGVPNMPMFIYKAIQDQMSPANETDPIVASFCAQGANILYHRNNIGGHNDELWHGRGRALAFLAAVLDDTPGFDFPLTGCQILNVTVAVTVDVVYTPAWEGAYQVEYPALDITPVNVTVFQNGSVLWPSGG